MKNMSIVINHYTWSVVSIDQHDPIMLDEGADIQKLGLCRPLEQRIYVADNMSDEMTKDSIIHELVHAFIFSYGYNIEGEESICNFVTANGEKLVTLANKIFRELFKNSEI